MSNHYRILLVSMLVITLSSCKQNSTNKSQETTLIINNTINSTRTDEVIVIDINDLSKHLNTSQEEIALSLPYQFVDQNDDGENEKLLLLVDMGANEKKELDLNTLLVDKSEVNFPKRTQAEISHKINGEWKEREYIGGEFVNTDYLKVPQEHTDHSWYIRYEGPGWESDKVGYRFYLDWRNATDIFGKKTNEMVLQNVGLDGFDSYHEPADWGMDILKVGASLGIGSLGFWNEEKAHRVAETDSLESKIIANGDIYSQVRTKYHGWKINDQSVNLISDFSITAGSRLTLHQIETDKNIDNLCTGIVKHDKGELITNAKKEKSGWGYMATFGEQSLADDQLGMAVIFNNKDLIALTEDKDSHVVVLKPTLRKLEYYFLAAWENEKEGIKDKKAFIQYLEQTIAILNNPLETSMITKK